MTLNIPPTLLQSLSETNNFDEKAFVEAHREENKITSIRLNPFKKQKPDFVFKSAVLWAENSFYLTERPSFTYDPLFHAGCYYVQEAGSMFIEFALKSTVDFSQSIKVLDLCAAPGGKSTLINSLLNSESLLVANEIIRARAQVLVENLGKWGTSNTVVTNSDPQKFAALSGFFDVLVVDAPCSGSGLFRKQPEAIAEWSEDNVNQCSVRQKTILDQTLSCLKEDGILVYSTCSYSAKENEEIVDWLVNEHGMEYMALPISKDWGIVETNQGYRFYPHLTQSEGFFCAVLKKRKQSDEVYILKRNGNIDASKSERLILEPFLKNIDSLIIKKNNQFHQLNQADSEFINAFEKQLYFKKAGCVLGEIKGTDMVPNQELAWSINQGDSIKRIDLDKENAIKFLRKENFAIDAPVKGFALITHKNFGLGWAKILPNRINNYLPNELRILK